MAIKKQSHTFSIHLYGRAIPLLCTFVAINNGKRKVKLSLTHAMTTTCFVVPVEVCEEIITVLRNAVEDSRKGLPIVPVAPAMQVQSDGEGAAG